jgi:hypothetical protein
MAWAHMNILLSPSIFLTYVYLMYINLLLVLLIRHSLKVNIFIFTFSIHAWNVSFLMMKKRISTIAMAVGYVVLVDEISSFTVRRVICAFLSN